MNKYKWEKFKLALKKKKKLLIASGGFLLFGIICWCIGAILSGTNPLVWLSSPFAITIYCCLGVILLVAIWIVAYEYRNHMGE